MLVLFYFFLLHLPLSYFHFFVFLFSFCHWMIFHVPLLWGEHEISANLISWMQHVTRASVPKHVVQREKCILRRVHLSEIEVWENRNITMIVIYYMIFIVLGFLLIFKNTFVKISIVYFCIWDDKKFLHQAPHTRKSNLKRQDLWRCCKVMLQT